MPSKPVLSEADKRIIKEKLKHLCEDYWIHQGYKKTNIKELCSKVNVSIGTFYSIFPTKEDLFLDTIMSIQNNLITEFNDILLKEPSMDGFSKSMKNLLREYASKPFLYNVDSSDFWLVTLTDESRSKVQFDSTVMFRNAVQLANLKLKIDENEAFGICSALLSTINVKNTLSVSCDYFQVIDFMVDKLMIQIFK